MKPLWEYPEFNMKPPRLKRKKTKIRNESGVKLTPKHYAEIRDLVWLNPVIIKPLWEYGEIKWIPIYWSNNEFFHIIKY